MKTGIFPVASSTDRAAASVTRSASCTQNTPSVIIIARTIEETVKETVKETYRHRLAAAV
jgi:hypothetical protein